MFDDFKVANYSKALVSPELYARHLSRLFSGDVVDGLTVVPGTGLQVVLQPGNTFIRYGSSAVASARLVSLVNTFTLNIATPDVSNPRHDLVVVYVDTSVSLPGGTPTTANLDGKGVAKAVVVTGTPSSSPTDPNATAIQAAIGSSAYSYTIVARVRVNAGVSVIAANLITDLRTDENTDHGSHDSEGCYDYCIHLIVPQYDQLASNNEYTRLCNCLEGTDSSADSDRHPARTSCNAIPQVDRSRDRSG